MKTSHKTHFSFPSKFSPRLFQDWRKYIILHVSSKETFVFLGEKFSGYFLSFPPSPSTRTSSSLSSFGVSDFVLCSTHTAHTTNRTSYNQKAKPKEEDKVRKLFTSHFHSFFVAVFCCVIETTVKQGFRTHKRLSQPTE